MSHMGPLSSICIDFSCYTHKYQLIELCLNIFCFQTSPYLSSRCGTSSEPNSLGSSPCSSPLSNHRQHHQNGHVHRHHRRDGYSSLERLNRKPRVNKCSREKLFLRRASLQTVTMSLRSEERSPSLTRRCSRGSSSDEGDGDSFSDSTEFIRNRKERSTVLVRRFFKNNQKVSKCYIPFSVGLEILSIFVVVMSVYLTLLLRPCPHVEGSFLTRSTPLSDYPVHMRVFDIISPPTVT